MKEVSRCRLNIRSFDSTFVELWAAAAAAADAASATVTAAAQRLLLPLLLLLSNQSKYIISLLALRT